MVTRIGSQCLTDLYELRLILCAISWWYSTFFCFFRVESFIEHQDACKLGHGQQSEVLPCLQPPACLSRTASSPTPSPSSDTNFTFLNQNQNKNHNLSTTHHQNLDLQLSTTTTSTSNIHLSLSPKQHQNNSNTDFSTHLQLSIGSSTNYTTDKISNNNNCNDQYNTSGDEKIMSTSLALLRLKKEAGEQLREAMKEKAVAEEGRREAKRQIELAEKELANAKRMRQQAQAELQRALALKEHAIKKINSTILQITCQVCRQHFHLPKIWIIMYNSHFNETNNYHFVYTKHLFFLYLPASLFSRQKQRRLIIDKGRAKERGWRTSP